MNRLQLVQKLRQRTGGAGSGPTSTVGQSGEALDYVDWIDEAWLQLQAEEQDWHWMRKDASFQTVSGQIAYAATTIAPDWARWHVSDSWRLFTTAIGRRDEGFLTPWEFQTWRDSFDFGLQSTLLGRPTVFAVRPGDHAIVLGMTPNAAYTVTGQYQAAPIAMTADSDVPGLPTRFHMLIVYKAMMLYGSHEAAPEVYAAGKGEGDKMMAALRLDQLDTIAYGPPLA